MMGMDAAGCPLEKVCFRQKEAMVLLGVTAQHIMTEEDLARILLSERGARKGINGRQYYIALNKCDTPERRKRGARMARLLSEGGQDNVVLCMAGGLRPAWHQD